MPHNKYPIELDTDATMRQIADQIVDQIGPNFGFMVLVFPFGQQKGKTAHYISNAHRTDMIKVLREKADALEAGTVIPNGPGGVQ